MTDSVQRIRDESGSPPGVLIVEDEALVALYLEDTLDALGYRCCGVADSADGALSLAASMRPALALVDIGLRGNRDGVAVASELAELGVGVVFLTGSSDEETLRRVETAGSHGFLSKPCSESDIARALKLALAAPAQQ